MAAGLVAGSLLSWNVSNVGSVADPLAEAYGASLFAIGLLTTALFVSHLAVQLPAGVWSDRAGARTVALVACCAGIVGNAIVLVDDAYPLALAGRLVVGIGSGAGFVAGLDLVRAGGGGPGLQGLFGGMTMGFAGLALMVVPQLTAASGWRAPFASALGLSALAALPVLAARGLPRTGRAPQGVLRDASLLPLGAVHAATFGLAVVAGGWVVPLLERKGASTAAAGVVGGLVLFAGVSTRPLGGLLARSSRVDRRTLIATGLVACGAGALLLSVRGPLWLSALGALCLGLGSGLPFAAVFDTAQRRRPDAPGAAVGLVNVVAATTILVGTPVPRRARDGAPAGREGGLSAGRSYCAPWH